MRAVTVITGAEAEEIKRTSGRTTGTVEALLRGDVVWLPEHRGLGAWSRKLKARGMRGHTRRSERDGVKGIYAWAEKVTS